MNFKSMAEMRKEQEKGNKRSKRATESYIGGEKSGLAVQNPDNDLDGIVNQAKQHSSKYFN